MIMQQLTRRWVAVVTVGSFAASCAVSTYGYQYRVRQDFGGGEEPEPPSPEARSLLANATTVAFYPPDICLNTDAQTSDARVQQLRANCGVLLSTLERAAERAGYQVYSWQNLRGGRAIDFARQANVDVLFEINEFDLGSVDDSATERTLTFFEQSKTGVDTPLAVSEQLAQECRAYAAQSTPVGTDALSGTIDIKTVSVRDGIARWRYRKTLSQSLGRTYPQVTFNAVEQPNSGFMPLMVAGATALIVGGVFDAVGSGSGSGSGSAGSGSTDLTPVGNDLLLVGAVAVAGALLLQFGVGGHKQGPEEVMCKATPNVPTANPPAYVPPVGPISTEHTFTESTQRDPLVKQKELIRDTMIAQFIGVLKDARGNRPSGPPPTFAPPATPPPAAPAPITAPPAAPPPPPSR
jgi:hypothetical protein